MNNLLVVCVDRDNDLGKKAGVAGPVVGREAVLKAATRLALADPSEADANTMFAAVKKYDELRKSIKKVNIAALTGYGKAGFKSDKIINEQLDAVVKKFKPEGFVVVTDGAEDDQVIPILQGRARVVSKETVIVKQAQQIESAFFTIKEVLKDPFVARIVFGIPGILLLLFFALGVWSFQIIAFVFGAYLLMKGFGIEEPVIGAFRNITESISVQRASFPFYVGSLFIIAFGGVSAYTKFSTMQITDLVIDAVAIAHASYLFVALGAIAVVIGRCIDVIHMRKAYLLRKYFLSAVSVILLWLILDAGTLVFLRVADLNWFLMTILLSFIILLISFRLSEVLDVRERITHLLIGLPVYNAEGTWLGEVEAVDKRKRSIRFTESKTSKEREVSKKKFELRNGRVMVSA